MKKDFHVIVHFNEKDTMIWDAARMDFNGNYKNSSTGGIALCRYRLLV